MITVKRIYDEPSSDDGFRVLVDRLWPRGVSKERAHVDLWAKDVAPSTELRQWFHRETPLFDAFRERYRDELEANPGAVAALREIMTAHSVVTLLVGTRDPELNHGRVLRDYLLQLTD